LGEYLLKNVNAEVGVIAFCGHVIILTHDNTGSIAITFIMKRGAKVKE
jgi:hypothetical protein